MAKPVSSKLVLKSRSMKMSVPRLLIAAAVILSPVAMAGKKAAKPSVPAYEDAFLFTPVFSAAKSISYADRTYQQTGLENFGITRTVFDLALKGFEKLSKAGRISADSILTIVDFSKSSREKRMVVIDLKNRDVLFHTVVAHGRNTGQEFARSFSNLPRSHKSSLGFYVTRETYQGSNGLSLKLDGQERGFNDLAMARAIVIHGAGYANEEVVGSKGYLGRSYGCPALPQRINRKVIETIKGGNVIFLYYPDQKYLNDSQLLNG